MNGREGGCCCCWTASGGDGLAVGLVRGFRVRRGCVAEDIAGGDEGLIDAESALLMVAAAATECDGGGNGGAGSSLRIWRSDMLARADGVDERASERRWPQSEKCYVFARV